MKIGARVFKTGLAITLAIFISMMITKGDGVLADLLLFIRPNLLLESLMNCFSNGLYQTLLEVLLRSWLQLF